MIIRTINVPYSHHSIAVTFTATRLFVAKWYPKEHSIDKHGELVTDTQYDSVTSSIRIVNYNPNYRYNVYFDTEGDDDPNTTLALST